jgi:hypothetical protein
MPFCLQYHNYERIGRLPMPVEKGDYRLFGDGRGQTLTIQTFVESHVGSTVFQIVGIGKDPRRYYLWDCFVVGQVSRAGEIFTASGPGFMLNPPQLLAGPHFDEFKEACAGFAMFCDITRLPFTSILEKLAARFHRPNVIDEQTREFCENLVQLIPDDSDAQDLRNSYAGVP